MINLGEYRIISLEVGLAFKMFLDTQISQYMEALYRKVLRGVNLWKPFHAPRGSHSNSLASFNASQNILGGRAHADSLG